MNTTGNILCPLCSARDPQITLLSYPLFRHMDFSVFHTGPNRIGHCRTCHLVFRITDTEEQEVIDAMYTGEEYLRHEEPHTLIIPGHDKPVPLSCVQAGLLSPLFAGTDISVLDIGCFDGKLLTEIEKVSHASVLCGFDVRERLQYPRGPAFRFFSGSLETVHGCFDWILMSHSLQYIHDMYSLFSHIRRLLKPDGRLFIHVPDFSAKPATLLLGDLYYHYTPAILGTILRRMGFKPCPLENDCFPRDILVTASQRNHQGCCVDEADTHFETGLAYLAGLAEGLNALEISGSMGVLGTTIDAAFSEYCLGNRASFFVDENPGKTGAFFHGKPVLHPRSLQERDVVVIPMGKSGEIIRQRFSRHYSGTYVCV